jgi:hypothetical protein
MKAREKEISRSLKWNPSKGAMRGAGMNEGMEGMN